jgi:hypothetical protein
MKDRSDLDFVSLSFLPFSTSALVANTFSAKTILPKNLNDQNV